MTKILGFALVIGFAVVAVSAQTGPHVRRQYRKAGVVRVGPATTYLKTGLITEDVFRLLGKPANISERMEDGLIVTTCEFQRGADRVLVAQFVSGTLVNYRIEARAQIAKAIR